MQWFPVINRWGELHNTQCASSAENVKSQGFFNVITDQPTFLHQHSCCLTWIQLAWCAEVLLRALLYWTSLWLLSVWRVNVKRCPHFSAMFCDLNTLDWPLVHFFKLHPGIMVLNLLFIFLLVTSCPAFPPPSQSAPPWWFHLCLPLSVSGRCGQVCLTFSAFFPAFPCFFPGCFWNVFVFGKCGISVPLLDNPWFWPSPVLQPVSVIFFQYISAFHFILPPVCAPWSSSSLVFLPRILTNSSLCSHVWMLLKSNKNPKCFIVPRAQTAGYICSHSLILPHLQPFQHPIRIFYLPPHNISEVYIHCSTLHYSVGAVAPAMINVYI